MPTLEDITTDISVDLKALDMLDNDVCHAICNICYPQVAHMGHGCPYDQWPAVMTGACGTEFYSDIVSGLNDLPECDDCLERMANGVCAVCGNPCGTL